MLIKTAVLLCGSICMCLCDAFCVEVWAVAHTSTQNAQTYAGLFSVLCVNTNCLLLVTLVCLLHILFELVLEIVAKNRNITDMAAYLSVPATRVLCKYVLEQPETIWLVKDKVIDLEFGMFQGMGSCLFWFSERF